MSDQSNFLSYCSIHPPIITITKCHHIVMFLIFLVHYYQAGTTSPGRQTSQF